MNKLLRAELLAMKQTDLAYRESILEKGSLYEGYDKQMEAIHLQNATRLNQIIEEKGWPGKSLVGEDGASAAFLIAQHAISNPALQRSFLISLSHAASTGEATEIQRACLQDRILYNEGKQQQYGLLFDWSDEGEMIANVDDINAVNQRRKAIGLKTTVQEALEAHRKEVEEEGGGAPKDIGKHREMAKQWAIRVGWKS